MLSSKAKLMKDLISTCLYALSILLPEYVKITKIKIQIVLKSKINVQNQDLPREKEMIKR